ncbi:MAG: NAD(P)/FAD-dependent oxidoreductase, partial [Chloroflexota bacterium]
ARALFAGNAAHVIQPLDYPLTAAFGIVLAGSAHAVGWGMPRGGSQSLADALTAHLRSLGGEVVTDTPIEDIDALPPSDAVMLDITPHQIADIAANHLPDGYLRALRRYRYGPGVFKVDWALSEPVPWTAKAARHAGTVHIGGTFDEIAVSEHAAYYGRVPREPYVLLAQQSIADPTRAPEGKHTLWAYCHVPHGSDADMTDVIENQIERFAPGFKDTILAKHTMNAPQMQAYNPNYIGGDINGGVQDIGQLFLRPTPRLQAYTTPNPSLFICSSASPPGGGVHGMAGYHAAQVALKNFN